MKFVLCSLLIDQGCSFCFVFVYFGAYAAPNKDKSTQKCPQCRLKDKDTPNPVCGKLNGIVGLFDSESIFHCFAKCRRVDHELLSYKDCVPDSQEEIIFEDTTPLEHLYYLFDVREGY